MLLTTSQSNKMKHFHIKKSLAYDAQPRSFFTSFANASKKPPKPPLGGGFKAEASFFPAWLAEAFKTSFSTTSAASSMASFAISLVFSTRRCVRIAMFLTREEKRREEVWRWWWWGRRRNGEGCGGENWQCCFTLGKGRNRIALTLT